VKQQVKTVDVMRKLPILFRYADVAKFVANPNVFLTRAHRAGYVSRLMKGAYLNLFMREAPAIEEVACFVRWPSYVSCEWALNYHGVILQSPQVCTVVTLSGAVGARNRVEYQGIAIEYSRVSDSFFWGFEKNKGFNMAAPEKALLDTVYLRKSVPFFDELETENLDMVVLRDMANRFPQSTQKRLQALVERNSGIQGF